MAQPWAPPYPSGQALPWPDGGSRPWDAPTARPPAPPPLGQRSDASAAPATPAPHLDTAIAFLKKRDGIDKLLKLIRYASKLALATTVPSPVPVQAPAPAFAWAGSGGGWVLPPPPPPSLPTPSSSISLLTRTRLESLEASIGDARKAYRLGKWLQGVAGFKEAGGLDALVGARGLAPALAALAAAGDAAYFFLEQGTWLVRAGVVPRTSGPPIARASAAAELVSYAGSAGGALVALDGLALREVALRRAHLQVGGGGDPAALAALRAELGALAAKRATLRLALLQDACDALLALQDLRGGGGRWAKKGGFMDSKALLAAAGLVSGLLGARKVWVATVRERGRRGKGQ